MIHASTLTITIPNSTKDYLMEFSGGEPLRVSIDQCAQGEPDEYIVNARGKTLCGWMINGEAAKLVKALNAIIVVLRRGGEIPAY